MGATPLLLSLYSNGAAVSGAKAYTYIKDTTTQQAAYTDAGLTTPAANPAVSNSEGRFTLYLDDTLNYTVVIRSSDDAYTFFEGDYVAGSDAVTVVQTGTIDSEGQENVDIVAARIADVAVVAARDTDIGTVASRDADIGVLADALEDGTINQVTLSAGYGFDTRADFIADTESVGALVKIYGHTTASDGGGAFYKRVASEPSHAGKIQHGGGTWFEYYADDEGVRRSNPRAFGAVGDAVNSGTDQEGNWTGTDDTTALQNACSVAVALNYPFWIPRGKFLVTDEITAEDLLGLQQSPDFEIIGEDREESVIVNKYLMTSNDQLIGFIGEADDHEATTVTLASAGTKGDDTITVNDASLLAPGQWVHIIDHSESVFNPLTAGPVYPRDDIQAVADGITSTVTDFTTEPRYAAGKWILVGGEETGFWRFQTAGSTWAKIQNVAPNKITFVAGTFSGSWGIDAGTNRTIRVRFKDSATCRVGSAHQVLSVDTGTDEVRLKQPLEFNMTAYTGDDADDGLPRGTTIRRFTNPTENITIKNLTFAQHAFPFADPAGSPSTDTDLRAKILHLVNCINVNIEGVNFSYPRAYEVELSNCINFKVRGTQTYSDDLSGEDRYTILSRGSCYGTIESGEMFGGRHYQDAFPSDGEGIESAHVLVHGNKVSGSYGASFGSHYGARDWVWNDNLALGIHLADGGTLNDGMAGFQCRGRDLVISGNQIKGFRNGVYAVYCDGQRITNNQILDCRQGIKLEGWNNVEIEGNFFSGCEVNDIYISDDIRYGALGFLNVSRNYSLSTPSSAGLEYENSGDFTGGALWIFQNNEWPATGSDYLGLSEDQIYSRGRASEEFTLYNDETGRYLRLDAGNSAFQQARIITGYDELGFVGGSSFTDEYFRMTDSENISFKTLRLRVENTASLGVEAAAAGSIVYCLDGDGGSPCIAVRDGSNWRRVALGSNISNP
jgi:hypothetical protein